MGLQILSDACVSRLSIIVLIETHTSVVTCQAKQFARLLCLPWWRNCILISLGVLTKQTFFSLSSGESGGTLLTYDLVSFSFLRLVLQYKALVLEGCGFPP